MEIPGPNPVGTCRTGAALQAMSKECPVKKDAVNYCKAAMTATKTVDDKLTSHIDYLYQVSGGSNRLQGDG